MNLRKYYERVSEVRQSLKTSEVYLTSVATANGGKEGRVAEVDADTAARMLVDGIAREATGEEIVAYLQECEAQRIEAEEENLRNRLRITLVNEPEFASDTAKTSAKSRNRG